MVSYINLKKIVDILDGEYQSTGVFITFNTASSAGIGLWSFSLGGYDDGYTFTYGEVDILKVNYDTKDFCWLNKVPNGIKLNTSKIKEILRIKNYSEVKE